MVKTFGGIVVSKPFMSTPFLLSIEASLVVALSGIRYFEVKASADKETSRQLHMFY